MTKKAKSKATKAANKRTSTERFNWNDVVLSVRHQPDYVSKGWDHIELRVVAPTGAILPITETGYLSHFLTAADLKAAGGPKAFFQAWLERELKTKKWRAGRSKIAAARPVQIWVRKIAITSRDGLQRLRRAPSPGYPRLTQSRFFIRVRI